MNTRELKDRFQLVDFLNLYINKRCLISQQTPSIRLFFFLFRLVLNIYNAECELLLPPPLLVLKQQSF